MEYKFDTVLFNKQSEFQQIQIVETQDFGRLLILNEYANLAENDRVEYTHTLMNLPHENYSVNFFSKLCILSTIFIVHSFPQFYNFFVQITFTMLWIFMSKSRKFNDLTNQYLNFAPKMNFILGQRSLDFGWRWRWSLEGTLRITQGSSSFLCYHGRHWWHGYGCLRGIYAQRLWQVPQEISLGWRQLQSY